MHAASGGGFFDVERPEPPEPDELPTPPWMQPPRDELPGRVVLDEVLFRSERVVLVLREIRRFGNGLDLRLGWSARRAGMPRREWDESMQSAMGWQTPPGDESAFRVGLRLPDGAPLLPLHLLGNPWGEPESVAPPTLMANHGGSSGGADWYDGRQTAWLWWPTRPEGDDLELVVEWRGLEIPELSHRIPADVLAAAPAPRPLWD
ncbi:hypothetical protein [Agromyces sp. C10]|uniref:hypothetical protein n=1 Tax=Agromyces sp. C10 TaxID=2935077 RepID=UPI00200B1726|nr:hypothetical protein [Agromyces sp. C10]MCK8608098.1 hypothetical protein [Agromyces sp. C10]